jgi:hypothetical protein
MVVRDMCSSTTRNAVGIDHAKLCCSDQAQLYILATLTSSNKGWQSLSFYLRNNDDQLLEYTQRVVTAEGEH